MKDRPNTETALAHRHPSPEFWREPDWQRLWLALQGRPWRSLALVPAGEGGPADSIMRVAVTLARTGMIHLGSPIQVADGTKVPLAYLQQFMDEVRRCTAAGDMVLIALAPLAKTPITLSIAQAADAAVLCVLIEHMASAQAKATVAQIGINRFVGSVILRNDKD
jgi:hypothetical protein